MKAAVFVLITMSFTSLSYWYSQDACETMDFVLCYLTSYIWLSYRRRADEIQSRNRRAAK